jgi:hypothetical protein
MGLGHRWGKDGWGMEHMLTGCSANVHLLIAVVQQIAVLHAMQCKRSEVTALWKRALKILLDFHHGE